MKKQKPDLNTNAVKFKALVEPGDWFKKIFKNYAALNSFRRSASYHGCRVSIRKTSGKKNEYLVELKERRDEHKS